MFSKSTTASVIEPTLRQRVLALSLPAVGEQVLNTLVGLVDTFLVGHLSATAASHLGYRSAEALAGVGLANQIIGLIMLFFIAISVGATALIARAKGAGDLESGNRVLQQSLLLGLASGIVVMLVVLPLAMPLMHMLGADPTVAPLGAQFITISAIGFIPASLLFVGTSALRGAGDTRTPLLLMLGINIVNIVLSWLLINGNMGAPMLGVEGTAIGAAVARGSGGLVILGLLLRGRSGLKLNLSLRIDKMIMQRVSEIGLPSGLEQLVFQGALLIFARSITSLGTIAYAAHNLVLSIQTLSLLPGIGYAIAASTLVGQSLGAGKPDEAEAGNDEALLQGGILMSVLGLMMFLFPKLLLGIFTNDPAVIAAGTPAMRISGMVQPFYAITLIVSGGLRGAGDTRWPLYIKIISTWILRLPLVMFLLYLNLGLVGAWLAILTDFMLQSWLTWRRFHQGRWKHIQL